MEARFTHDCADCVFLGQYLDFDLYFHPGENSTVIARYGSDGPDYISGMTFANVHPALKEAKTRAISNGLPT